MHTHANTRCWMVCANEKRMENQFSNAWKGGCAWPHLCFDAIGRALVAKASKGPRWKCIQNAHKHTHTHSLALALAHNCTQTLSTLIYSYAPQCWIEIFTTLNSFLLLYFFPAMHHGFLFASVNFVSVLCVFLRFALALLYLFLLLFLRCLYNMINVDVYIAVRSKRKYIEKWCSLYVSVQQSSVLRLTEKMKIREQKMVLRFSTFPRRACGREMEAKWRRIAKKFSRLP